jgi:hypothetical protein
VLGRGEQPGSFWEGMQMTGETCMLPRFRWGVVQALSMGACNHVPAVHGC